MLLIAGPSHMTTHILDWYFKHTSSAFLVASCWFFSSSFRTKELSSTFFLCSILNSWLPPFESYGKKYQSVWHKLKKIDVSTNISIPYLKATSQNNDYKYVIITIDRKKNSHIAIHLPFFKIYTTINTLSDTK